MQNKNDQMTKSAAFIVESCALFCSRFWESGLCRGRQSTALTKEMCKTCGNYVRKTQKDKKMLDISTNTRYNKIGVIVNAI